MPLAPCPLTVRPAHLPAAHQCPPLVVPHGRVQPLGPRGQEPRMVRVRCQPGFKLFGEKEPLCVNGQWSAPQPACVSE